MQEVERLRAQNKILRDMLEEFIDATNSNPENAELSVKKTLHIRMKSMAMLKRIDDFSIKRVAVFA